MGILLFILGCIAIWIICGLLARFLQSLYFYHRDDSTYLYGDAEDGVNAVTAAGPIGLIISVIYWIVVFVKWVLKVLRIKDPKVMAKAVYKHFEKRGKSK